MDFPIGRCYSSRVAHLAEGKHWQSSDGHAKVKAHVLICTC